MIWHTCANCKQSFHSVFERATCPRCRLVTPGEMEGSQNHRAEHAERERAEGLRAAAVEGVEGLDSMLADQCASRLRETRAELASTREEVKRLAECELSLTVALTEHMEPEVRRLNGEVDRLKSKIGAGELERTRDSKAVFERTSNLLADRLNGVLPLLAALELRWWTGIGNDPGEYTAADAAASQKYMSFRSENDWYPKKSERRRPSFACAKCTEPTTFSACDTCHRVLCQDCGPCDCERKATR